MKEQMKFSFTWKKRYTDGVGTGLDRDVFEKIYQRLGWHKYQFDYIGIGSETGRSRPHPDMILDMLKKLPDIDRSGLLKVGDTTADIQEGKMRVLQQ